MHPRDVPRLSQVRWRLVKVVVKALVGGAVIGRTRAN